MEIILKNGRKIGDNHPAYIIAEIGINHNGSMEIAKKLIDKASIIGVDAIKFQKRTIKEMYLKEFLDAPYENRNSFGKTYGEHKKFLEFSNEQLIELKEYTKYREIDFLVSGFDFSGFDFIEKELDVLFHKLPSPLVTHTPLLKHIAKFGKPIILSTGMHDFSEVKNAVETIKKINKQLIILQCTTSYPTNDIDVNLSVIKRYREELGVLAGYSSHDRGVVIPAASVVLGGCVIEKHYTLDRTMQGPDHVASVEPRGLELIIRYTRAVEAAIGDDKKELKGLEFGAKIKYSYSCVAKSDIQIGQTLTEDMIIYKVPGTGLKPSQLDLIIGKKAIKKIWSEHQITLNDIK